MKAILKVITEKSIQLFNRFWQMALLCVLALTVLSCIDFPNIILEEAAVLILFAVNISLEIKNFNTSEWL